VWNTSCEVSWWLTSIDIDWEYPGGNGADYKQVRNSEKAYQIDAFPKLLAATRAAIGDKLLSIAVPGKKGKSTT
jgi:chitinase